MATRKKPKTTRVPRTRAGGEWTEARYWTFIRTTLRSGARRYPPIVRQALGAARERYRPQPGESPTRRKWVYRCAICDQLKFRDQVEVDHIEPCGSCRSYEEVGEFARRMFCEPDGLRILCKSCHQEVTDDQRRLRRANAAGVPRGTSSEGQGDGPTDEP